MDLPEDVERALYRALLTGDPAADSGLTALRRDHPEHVTAIDRLVRQLRAAPLDEPSGEDMLRRLAQVVRLSRSEQRYEFVQELGAGGLGTVSVVRDRLLGRKVALKTIHPRRGTRLGEIDPMLVHRFLDEAQVAAQLWHPAIPTVHDVGVDGLGVPFFTMRYVQGHALEALLSLHAQGHLEWPRRRLVRVLSEAAGAVAHAHRHRVFHRDLKPANIVVGRFGEVSVIDWGLAKVHRALSVAEAGPRVATDRRDRMHESGLGSPGYTAPEQWRGEFGPGGDVFSLGCILHELLVGLPPPIGPQTTSYALPQEAARRDDRLAAISAKAIAMQPSHRYARVDDLRADLEAYLDDRPVSALRAGPWARLQLALQRQRRGRRRSRGAAEVPANASIPRPASASSAALAELPALTVATLFPRHDERKADSAARPPREHRAKASSQRIAAITALGAPWPRFDRGAQIGEGGMAKIHRAADTLLRRDVAVKTVRGNLAADFDDELLARALDEAQIAAQLDHPSILAPHEITLDNEGKLTIVMPIAPGGSLADHLRSTTPAHWRANTALLLSTCRGLAFAHGKGVVHRDVKPGNIVLGDHGDAYLTDWGLALLHRLAPTSESRIRLTRGDRFDPAGDAEETLSDEVETSADPVTRLFGQVVGTPHYMSPEQCQFDPTAVGPPSDVFAAGVVLYEILTGERPFAWSGTSMVQFLEQRTTQQAPPVRSRCPRTPRAVADVCDRALRLHPLDRYGNAGEFAAALEAALH